MVLLGVQVQEVGHVDVGQAELLVLPVVPVVAVGVVEDLDPVHIERVPSVPIFPLSKLCVPINTVDCLYMLCNHAQNLLLSLLLISLLLVDMLPQQWISLYEEGARFLIIWRWKSSFNPLGPLCVLVLGVGVLPGFTSFSFTLLLFPFLVFVFTRWSNGVIMRAPLDCSHPPLNAWGASAARRDPSKLQSIDQSINQMNNSTREVNSKSIPPQSIN